MKGRTSSRKPGQNRPDLSALYDSQSFRVEPEPFLATVGASVYASLWPWVVHPSALEVEGRHRQIPHVAVPKATIKTEHDHCSKLNTGGVEELADFVSSE